MDAVPLGHHAAQQELQQSPVVPSDVSANFTLVVDRLKPPGCGPLDGDGFEVISRGALSLFEGGRIARIAL
jgi:hypothetical protein